MANHLTLPDPITVTIEANTVEEALGRLSNQHGTAAKIVRADRVRKGGFAGFFTREVVEIEAEVTSEGPGVAGAFDRMLAAAEREEMSEAALPKSERAPARTLSLPGPDLMAGANWDGAHMRAIGLPDPIVSALGDLTPDDDIGHVTALSVALSAVCGPLPTGPARLIGDRSDRLRGAVPLEESETGYIHLVVGDYLPDSLP
ncbi:MAG: hypothetical protein OEX04_05890, partial [Acidimicrobiia bacterium]|nr:hypothetical protein [Acidimicrobiia bacterium]